MSSIAGGYVGVLDSDLRTLASLVRDHALSVRALRVWAARVEREHSLGVDRGETFEGGEVLTAPDDTSLSALRRITGTSRLGYARGGHEELVDALSAAGVTLGASADRGGSRWVPVPRRLLGHLARCRSLAEIVVALDSLLVGAFKRGESGSFSFFRLAKSHDERLETTAGLWGISPRQVRRGRERLGVHGAGWLMRESAVSFRVNHEWEPSERVHRNVRPPEKVHRIVRPTAPNCPPKCTGMSAKTSTSPNHLPREGETPSLFPELAGTESSPRPTPLPSKRVRPSIPYDRIRDAWNANRGSLAKMRKRVGPQRRRAMTELWRDVRDGCGDDEQAIDLIGKAIRLCAAGQPPAHRGTGGCVGVSRAIPTRSPRYVQCQQPIAEERARTRTTAASRVRIDRGRGAAKFQGPGE